ncbi:MAG: zinc ribbon domain-containing protein, partial [Phycisphaerales bacterium]|nr:zinc ribbon domain-containing protein [Phycisphaerales bacterium]
MVGPQLIIYGTRGVTTTKDKGEFHCPNCGDRQPYRLRRVRRFFTLYFIPLIPLDKLGEYIECDVCNGTYELDVLEYEPGAADAAFEAEFHFAMRRVMILMMLADGAIDDAEVATICQIYQSMSGQPLDELTVRQEAMQCQQAGIAVEQYLASTAGKL